MVSQLMEEVQEKYDKTWSRYALKSDLRVVLVAEGPTACSQCKRSDEKGGCPTEWATAECCNTRRDRPCSVSPSTREDAGEFAKWLDENYDEMDGTQTTTFQEWYARYCREV